MTTTIPDGWECLTFPKIGTWVCANHPVTCLNPSRYFQVSEIKYEQSVRVYVKGEDTCWFSSHNVLPAPDGFNPNFDNWTWPHFKERAPTLEKFGRYRFTSKGSVMDFYVADIDVVGKQYRCIKAGDMSSFTIQFASKAENEAVMLYPPA